MSVATQNPYLTGNFAPVSVETTAVDLPVTGTVPAHLDGRYLRNGPNPAGPVDPARHHWFLGTGMVHGVRLRAGKAQWYRNRFVRTSDQDLPANTNVVVQAGRTYAIVEAGGRPYELTEDLDTIGRCAFDGTLPGGWTAHPKRDPHTGELHAVSYWWGWGNKVQYTVLGTDARIRRVVDIEVTGSPMMHDFALTENHIVLFDLPCVLRMDGSAFPYSWDPNYPARVGVLPRSGGNADVRWFEVEPCYVFHPLNAYDDGDRVIVDVVRHPRMFDTHRLGPDEGPPTLDRWTVEQATGKVASERLDDRGQEFPRVDERLVGRRHRYGYAVTFDGITGESLIRHDLAGGAPVVRSFGAGHDVSEFVFVPDEHDSPEDRGTLIGFVHDPDRDAADLMLLDAQTLQTKAAVHLPVRVPAGFHGNWAPAEPN
jgi:carotenoid cleavage dioxygenase